MFRIQKLDLLVAIYIFCVAVSELMGAKTFPLFHLGNYTLNASVAIFTIPLLYTINDSITEVFGKERTRSIIWSGIIVVGLILLFSLLATSLPPSTRFMKSESAYKAVFGLSARFSAASLIAFIFSEFLDVFVFVKLRSLLGRDRLWLRNNVSNFVSEFADTAIFMTLAFWALEHSFSSNIAFITSIGIPYFLLRCALSVLETPLVYLGVNWLKSERSK